MFTILWCGSCRYSWLRDCVPGCLLAATGTHGVIPQGENTLGLLWEPSLSPFCITFAQGSILFYLVMTKYCHFPLCYNHERKRLHFARLGSFLRPAYTFLCCTHCGQIFLWAVFFQLHREQEQPQKGAVKKQSIQEQQCRAIPFTYLEDQVQNRGIMLEASEEMPLQL